MELNFENIKPSMAGPKRPHDHVEVANMAHDFKTCMSSPVGFKVLNIADDKLDSKANFAYEGKKYEIGHDSIVILAITRCINTLNPSVMLHLVL